MGRFFFERVVEGVADEGSYGFRRFFVVRCGCCCFFEDEGEGEGEKYSESLAEAEEGVKGGIDKRC